MSFLSKITAFNHSTPPRQLNPEGRYIHLDGSPYGSRHVWRFLSRPGVKAGAIVTTFLAAGHALLKPESARQMDFLHRAAYDLPWVAIVNWQSWRFFNEGLPAPKSSVIDKLGYLASDPTATITMEHYYKRIAKKEATLAAGLYTVMSLIVIKNPFDMYPLCLMAGAGWYYYAGHKLGKGDWTIQTSPPKLKSKKEAAFVGTLATEQGQGFSRFIRPVRRAVNRDRTSLSRKATSQPN